MPPLRERGDDILLLAVTLRLRSDASCVARSAVESRGDHGTTAASLAGNVRELENAIERACIISDTLVLQPSDLGLGSRRSQPNETLEQLDLSGTLSEVAHRALRVVERKNPRGAGSKYGQQEQNC